MKPIRKNKKAQAFPFFVLVFTIIILSVAFFNVTKSRQNIDVRIGEKQSQVYASLQDADSMQLFVEQSAKLAAAESLDDISASCYYRESYESVVDPQESECGKYIYAMWSSKESLCLPDCQEAFKTSFHKNLINHLNEYFKAVGFSTPQNYNISLNISENFFKIFGKSYPVTSLNLLTLNQRLSIAKQSEYLSETETTLAKSADVEQPCEPKIWNKCDKTDDCKNILSLGEYNACDLNKDEPCSKEIKCDDGIDNDCDNKKDYDDPDCKEQIPEKECEPDEEKEGEACDTGLKGACKEGVEVFICDVNGFWPDTATKCKQTVFEKTEICDDSDNDLDCDGDSAKDDDDCKDPCEGVECLDICDEDDEDIRKHSGRCEAGECIYESESCKGFGCTEGVCNDDPCKDKDIICPDKCEGNTKLYEGKCEQGECNYKRESCGDKGCIDGVCNDCEPGKTDLRDSCDVPNQQGVCKEGMKEYICGDDGKWPTTFECKQTTFESDELCTNGLDDDCDGKTDSDDEDCFDCDPQNYEPQKKDCEVDQAEGICIEGEQTKTCEANGEWSDWSDCKSVKDPRPEVCTNGLDDDCDGDCDFDSNAGCEHGDDNCRVGVTSISVSETRPCPGEQITVSCTSIQPNVNSIKASIDGKPCGFMSWQGNNARFSCTTKTSTGSQSVVCDIDTLKSYASGTPKSTSINVGGVSCCNQYTTSGTCGSDVSCEWCSKCIDKYFTGGNDRCVRRGTCQGMCEAAQCGATCDDTINPCLPTECNDYCSAGKLYKTTDKRNVCTSSCSCTYNDCDTGTPVDCGTQECDANKHLTGSCNNPCQGPSSPTAGGSASCGTCTPSCTCESGWIDLNNNMNDGCEYSCPSKTQEICDNKDNNCDGQIDEGCDDDNDGYCDKSMSYSASSACPKGGDDCNDNDNSIYPGASISDCSNQDKNCNGVTDSAEEECKDPCEDITCESKCVGSLKKYNGKCVEGLCEYDTETCAFGCENAECKGDPCEGVECLDKCEGQVRMYQGRCDKGTCIYKRQSCASGCQNAVCNDCEPGREDLRKACVVPNVFGVCKKGIEIFICGADGKWPPTPSECRQTTFKTAEICTNDLDNDCDGLLPDQDKDCPGTYWNRCDKDDGKGNTRNTNPYNPCSLEKDQACEKETNCKDTIDNDCDGNIDCSDTDCKEKEECKPQPTFPKAFFSWPTNYPTKRFNSCFGLRPHESGSVDHSGVDIRSYAAATGKKYDVLAPADGVVKRVGDPQKMKKTNHQVTGGADCWGIVEIQHQYGIRSRFLHLNDVNVKVNQKVKRGQKIGVSGGSGHKDGKCSLTSFAPHIHMDVIYDGLSAEFNPNYCDTKKETCAVEAGEKEETCADSKYSGKGYECVETGVLECQLIKDNCFSQLCKDDKSATVRCCKEDVIKEEIKKLTAPKCPSYFDDSLVTPENLNKLNPKLTSSRPSASSVDKRLTKAKVQDIIEEASKKYDIPVSVIKAFITVESEGQEKYIQGTETCNSLGYCGPMQVGENACKDVGISTCNFNILKQGTDVRMGIMSGTAHLKDLKKSEGIDSNNPDIYSWAVAYNAGAGSMQEIKKAARKRLGLGNNYNLNYISWDKITIADVKKVVEEKKWPDDKAEEIWEYPYLIAKALSEQCEPSLTKVESGCQDKIYVPPIDYKVPKGTPNAPGQVTAPQTYAKSVGSSKAVSPLCFLDLTDVEMPLENNCYYSFNYEEIDAVCAEYNLPEIVYLAKKSPPIHQVSGGCIGAETTPGVDVDCKYFGDVSPRQTQDRVATTKVVIHHTAGSTAKSAVDSWIANGGASSAHYVIDNDGTIYYVIDESKGANHAGCKECDAGTVCSPECRSWPPPASNANSIGIEIVNTGYASDTYTAAQYTVVKDLVEDIADRHGITVNNDNVISHMEVTSGKWDPSPNFDWSQIGLPGHDTHADILGSCGGLQAYGYADTCEVAPSPAGGVVMEGNMEVIDEDYASTPTGYVPIVPPEVQSFLDSYRPKVDLSPLGKYEFKTGFTVQVNKKIDDPLKPVTDWFTETWNECNDDLAKCLDKKIDEFNDKPVEQAKFTIDFASELCEEKEIGFFYDVMEFFEDCFSNNMYGCACEFNLSKYYSSQDLFIKFDSDKASLWLRDEGINRIKQAEYVFAHGGLELDQSPYPYQELLLEFDEENYELKNSKLIGFEREDQNGIREGVSDLFDDYKIIQLTKKDADSKQSASFTNIPEDKLTKCLYKKDKFRLCAEPKEEFEEELFPVNFAIQFKDKPPEGLCDSDKIKVIPGNVKPDAMVGGIAEIFGFDLASIFSSIPIPAFKFLGLSLTALDIINNIPGQQDANLNVAVKVDDEDVAGYKVYCNDVPVDLGKEFLNTNTADSFVVIDERVNDKVSQLDTYVNNNPYSKYLQGIDCHVPVAEASGMIKNVPGVKGILEGETLTFTLRKCQGNIFVDKLLENEYCITLVPVDKNGQEMTECAVTNCAKTNSILSLVLKKLLESQLQQITVIPTDLIPEELQPYVSLPDSDDFASAILGERDFDFSDFVNLEQVQSDLTGALETMLSDTIGKEITGLALVNSIDDLSDWGRQTVLDELSKSIEQEDAKLLFDALVEGKDVGETAQRAAIEKGVDYVEDPKAKELLKEYLTEGDPKSIAFREMKSAFKEKYEDKIDEKKEALEKAAKDKKGEIIKDTVIEKALEKDCIKSYNVNIDDALDCLTEDEIDEIFNDILEGDFVDAQQALIEKGLDEIEDSKSKEILKQVVAQRDFKGAAKNLLMSELDKMPDSLKKEFIVDVLQGKDLDVESILQSEIVKIIPNINVKYVTDLVKNGNVKALIENTLKSELEKQLNIFLTQDCVPVNKDGEEN